MVGLRLLFGYSHFLCHPQACVVFLSQMLHKQLKEKPCKQRDRIPVLDKDRAQSERLLNIQLLPKLTLLGLGTTGQH